MPEAKRRAIRGSGMGVVFQEPGASLNPIRKIGRQFYDALHAHDRSITRAETQKRASAILKSMQFDIQQTAWLLWINKQFTDG